MNFNDQIMNRFFRPDKRVVWDWFSGNIGIRNKEVITTCQLGEISEDENGKFANDPKINETPVLVDMTFPLPAFAQSTPVENIDLGDMIYNTSDSGGVLGWVVSKKGTRFELIRPNGVITRWTPPNVNVLGMNTGPMVLKPLINILPSGKEGMGAMQNMLAPMMAMGMLNPEGDDASEMMRMMLMMQMMPGATSNTGGMNMMSMLPFLMLMKGGEGKSPFKGFNTKINFFDKAN